MTDSESIDYAALFAAVPDPCLVLRPDLVIADVNEAYLEATGSERGELLGRYVLDAFPQSSASPTAGTGTGAEDSGPSEETEPHSAGNLGASLQRALSFRQSDALGLRRYDLSVPGRPGTWEERWWAPSSIPVPGADGEVRWILVRVEDMTHYIRPRHGTYEEPEESASGAEAELYAWAEELQRLNEELRQANARESEVALTLQQAMLYSPYLPREGIAVRYLPAVGTLNVCGDWYDITDVSTGRYAAAVGDVVGHGLEAAGVMGMLRSALSAAMRATERPAEALQILGLYASSVDGAEAATAVKVRVDSSRRLLTYSSAGHLPPVLLHPGGDCELLDRATDPPLATRPEDQPRLEAGMPYTPGDFLVLYTDGLVERRGEDIDVGIGRLIDALGRAGPTGPEELADDLLRQLGVSSGAQDDIALVVIRL